MTSSYLQPSAEFNFTTAILSSQITFARAANTATVINSSGFISSANADVPRFDYDPVSLFCRGLLIEEARSNICLQSNGFDQLLSWNNLRATANAASGTSPDGTNNAFKLVEDTTAANSHSVQQTIATTAVAHTLSCYAKAGERTWIALRLRDSAGTNRLAYFNLGTGAVGTVQANLTATISNAGNGWYRCMITVTTAFSGNSIPGIFLATGDNVTVYDGNGTSGAYIYGAQLEAGSFATSYIPTTTAPITRNADVATITGTNFSDWWQSSKGGAIVNARPGTVSGTRPWVQFDDGTANEIIALRGNTTNPELYIVDGGTPQAQIDAGTIAANTDYSMTAWWQTNDCKARLNNGAVVTDTSATIPTVTQARLGSDGTNYLNGHLASISYYDTFSGQIYTRRKNKAVFSLL